MKDVLQIQKIIKTTELRSNKGQLVERGIPTNPRKITKEKYNLLLQSLDKSNLTQIRPLDVIEHMGKFIVLSGNQRLRALKELKIKEVPCNIIRDDLEPETYRQIVLQANTNYGEHDDDLLANEWDALELHEWGYDLPDWDDKKIKEEIQGDDDVPESAPAITVKGDFYTLGEHRLLCGDSTMIDDVEKLMDGEKADMVFTDPPYNTGMTSESQSSKNGGTLWKGKSSSGKARLSHMFNDSFTDNEWQEFMSAFCNNYYLSMKDNSVAYICLDWRRNHELIPHIKTHFKLSNVIIWDKVVHGLGSDYKYTYEIINVCKKGNPDIDSHQGEEAEYSDVWHIQRKMGRDKDHATKKPIELCERPIRHASKKGNLVLDLFLGSGSTLIACEKTNRKCYGMELDEKYCDVIVKRYIEFCVKNNKEAKVYRNGELISNDVFLVG
jgi:DNA modification methylase